jgi:DNA invertase Pin-like site-specific DNA recombinase
MLVLGYVRVSSLEQEHGYGPEVQAAAVVAYCQDKGLDPPEMIHESMSGESIIKRKELQQVLARAKEHQEGGGEAHIVFYRLDRLSRTLMDQETVVGLALRHGFRLHSTQPSEEETLDPAYAGDPMRTAIRQFMGLFAQLERATIQARLDSGLHAKAKTGKSTGGGLPFGYVAMNKDIHVDPTKTLAVRRVFELHKQGLDLASIVAITSREMPEQCGRWNKSSISRMIRRRELYEYGRYRTRIGVRPIDRPELIVLTPEEGRRQRIRVPISKEVPWDKVPDTVPVITLSLIIGCSITWITRQVKDRNLGVRWIKGKLFIPLESAKNIVEIAKTEAESKINLA